MPAREQNNAIPYGYFVSFTLAEDMVYKAKGVSHPGMYTPNTEGSASATSTELAMAIPGASILFDELGFRFIVDKNLSNYDKMKDWMLLNASGDIRVCDCTVSFLDAQMNILPVEIRYEDVFPVALGGLEFDVDTEEVAMVTTAQFRYSQWNIFRSDLTDADNSNDNEVNTLGEQI